MISIRQQQFDCTDMSTRAIKEIFYRKFAALTLDTIQDKERTFDMQFSDCWL